MAGHTESVHTSIHGQRVSTMPGHPYPGDFMKRHFALAVAASSAVLALAACGAPSGSSNEAAAADQAPKGLVKAGQVPLCIDPESPPLEYYADGTGGDIIGFDADAGRALAKHWGVDAKF